jgi:dolichol-phosphate mannosyltransferase
MKTKILIIGASGFIGAGVFEYLINNNFQVTGISRRNNPWRISSRLKDHYQSERSDDITLILNQVKPEVIINFAAYGAYSFQNNIENMVNSNLILLEKIANWSNKNGTFVINAGSSSEYGTNSAGPKENSLAKPNSFYAITKLAGTNLLEFYSTLGLKSVVLRLYSVYGPKEDPSRLMPAVIRGIIKGEWPSFTDQKISRDFIYIEDICNLIIKLIQNQDKKSEAQFNIYNVGSGTKTTIGDLIKTLELEFAMPKIGISNFPKRKWDIENWYANIDRVSNDIDWRPTFDLKTGLSKMRDWYLIADNVKYLNDEYSENQ